MTPDLARFTQMAQQNRKMRLNSLMGLLTRTEGLRASFDRQPLRKAVGVDGVRKADYQDGLDNINRPFLLIAGNIDQLAPPRAVKYAFEKMGSDDKELIVCSPTADGFSAPYDHGAIVFGKRAPEEVFPRIADWLDDRQS